MNDLAIEFPHNAYCPYFQRTVELIGRRWTASILRTLFAGTERFTDIAATVPGLSPRLLTERLEELREARLVAIEPGTKHGTYRLTKRGEDLRVVFSAFESWNARWYEADQQMLPPAPDLVQLAGPRAEPPVGG